jgi:hypothetical protein
MGSESIQYGCASPRSEVSTNQLKTGPNLNPGKKILAVLKEGEEEEPVHVENDLGTKPVELKKVEADLAEDSMTVDPPLPSKKRKQSSENQSQKKKKIRQDLCHNSSECTHIGSKICVKQLCRECCRKEASGCAFHDKKTRRATAKRDWCTIL